MRKHRRPACPPSRADRAVILRLRLVLIVGGVVAFTMAQRTGQEWLRWLGIALVLIALGLRFLRRLNRS
jgi:uncharacterized membrane protein YfcA